MCKLGAKAHCQCVLIVCIWLTVNCIEAKMGFSYRTSSIEDVRTLKPGTIIMLCTMCDSQYTYVCVCVCTCVIRVSITKPSTNDTSLVSTGSHIRVIRLSSSSNEQGYYDHHMLVVSVPAANKLRVLHYSQAGGEGMGSLNSFGGGGAAATVLEETVTIANGDKIELLEYPKDVECFSAEKSIRRAKQRLGEENYSFFSNNCECFVNWAITDQNISNQVEGGLLHAGAGFVAGVCRGYFQEGGSWSKALKEGASGASTGYSNFREKRQ